MYVVTHERKRQVKQTMRNLIVMFLTAVCFLFLLKLKWPKNKNFYDVTFDQSALFVTVLQPRPQGLLLEDFQNGGWSGEDPCTIAAMSYVADMTSDVM